MDTLASLALATEPPTEDLLDRKPHSKNEYIISKTMFKHIIGQAIFQLIVMMILVFLGDSFIPEYTDSYDETIFLANPEYKWKDGIIGGTVRSGKLIHINGDADYRDILDEFRIVSTLHFYF